MMTMTTRPRGGIALGRWDDVLRRLAELEQWRREHEIDVAGQEGRLLHSKVFWVLVVLALIGLLGSGGLVAKVFGWL